jgi:hypothetical protein
MQKVNSQMEEAAFEGFGEPTFTGIPNKFLDFLMQDLSESELKVMLYIFRHTYGYTTQYGDRKAADAISYSQFLDGIKRHDGSQVDRGAGVSERSLTAALAKLIDKGYIFKHLMLKLSGAKDTTIYELNIKGYSQFHTYTANFAGGYTANFAGATTANYTDTKDKQNKKVYISKQNKKKKEAPPVPGWKKIKGAWVEGKD